MAIILDHIYFGVKATAACPPNAWLALLSLIENNTPGTNDLSQNTFQKRYNIAGDAAIYEGNFNNDTVSLVRFRQHLVTASGIANNRLSVVTTTTQFAERPSLIASFRVDGTVMFRATIFGRNADNQDVTPEQSAIECRAYLAINTLEWDGVPT